MHSAVMRLHVVCLSVCPSVRPSVTFRYRNHIGWNSSKIISRPNSLRPMRLLTPTWVIWSDNTPKIRVEQGWGLEHIKATKSPKRCKIGPWLLLWTNRKSHTRFRLAPKLMTLDDLERPKRLSCRNKQSFRRSPEKVDRFILLAEKCRPKILVARNISYMRICAGFHRGGGVKCKRHADVHRDVFILGTRRWQCS